MSYHKELLGQWFAAAINGAPRGVTVQLERWARWERPEIPRLALAVVDSAGMRQTDCELSGAQALEMAGALETGAWHLRRAEG